MAEEKIDYLTESIKFHKEHRGKLEINAKVPLNTYHELSIAYSPGVAGPCLEIEKDPSKLKELTMCGETIAVITDGSAVLGLGNIGAKASLPVMEGKCVLFKRFGGIDAVPIALDTQDVDEIVNTVKMLAPSFGGINLEDISAPRCFEIEERLKKELDIPVFHDDQHGTAIITLAGIINSLKITNRKKEDVKVVMNGAGAAGIATVKLLHKYGIGNIVVCDSKGIISKDRTDLNSYKIDLLKITNKENQSGSLQDALIGSDIFIGVSKGNLLSVEDVKSMNLDPIIFGLSNPHPELNPELVKEAGVKIYATGRSDYPNQINNVTVFPGIFKGALKANARDITEEMKLGAAIALANMVEEPTVDKIVPKVFETGVADKVAEEVMKVALRKN